MMIRGPRTTSHGPSVPRNRTAKAPLPCISGPAVLRRSGHPDRPRRGLVVSRHTHRAHRVGAPVRLGPERENGRYFLVTPVEKIGIQVDDVPFIAVDFELERPGADQLITFETNVGDFTAAGAENPIRVERDPRTGEPSPYVHVRRGLEALIDRKSYYRLVEIGETQEYEHTEWFGLRSGGKFFPMIPAAELAV